MDRVSTHGYAAWLREARTDAALTQLELAKKIGVSRESVQMWEGGRLPRPKHRRRLREFFRAERDKAAEVAA